MFCQRSTPCKTQSAMYSPTQPYTSEARYLLVSVLLPTSTNHHCLDGASYQHDAQLTAVHMCCRTVVLQAAEYWQLAFLSLLSMVQSMVVWVGLAGGLIVCIWGCSRGTLTVGDTVLFITMMQQLYVPLTYFGSYYRQVSRHRTAEVTCCCCQVSGAETHGPLRSSKHLLSAAAVLAVQAIFQATLSSLPWDQLLLYCQWHALHVCLHISYRSRRHS